MIKIKKVAFRKPCVTYLTLGLFLLLIMIPVTLVAMQQDNQRRANATATDSARIEAEAGTLSGPVSIISDTAASGGQAVVLNSNHSPTPTGVPGSGPAAMPIISRGLPAYATSSWYPPTDANDNSFDTSWRSIGAPAWIAYDLSSVPASQRGNVVVVWYANCCSYDNTISGTGAYNIPGSYTIEANAAAGGTGSAPTSGWVVLTTVTNNTYHSRQHVLNLTGYNWIRMNISAIDGSSGNMDASINLDVHNTAAGTADDFIIYGDSITQGAMGQETENSIPSFQQLIQASLPAQTPIEENGGIGYQTTGSALTFIDKQLAIFPGKYVGLAYGTNDANNSGCISASCLSSFFNNYVQLVQKVLNLGKVPIVPTIPWGCTTNLSADVPSYNQQIQNLYNDMTDKDKNGNPIGPQIVHGPDLYAFFNANQSYVSSNDCIHPNTAGMAALRQQWANQMLSTVYQGKTALGKQTRQLARVTIRGGAKADQEAPEKKSLQSGASAFFTSSFHPVAEAQTATPTNAATTLPGETFWPNGVSNLIFGTNDTGEWSWPNIEFSNSQSAPGTVNTVAQNLIKQAGFTFMRSFIPHTDFATGKEMTDAEIAARLNTIANTNEQCLGTLVDINPASSSQLTGYRYTDLQFAEHVLTLSDGNHPGYAKCSIFEIGNEPNFTPYLNSWNVFVSDLKKIRPDAKFLGPVLGASNVAPFLRGIVQNNYPRPDGISWHWYPCGYGTLSGWSNCPLSITSQIISDAQTVRNDLQTILGYQLPIGISEWSDDPSSYSSMTLTEPQMSQFITAALNSMVQAKLDFANEFDMQSYAAYGSLDMLDNTNTPRPYFNAFASAIKQYQSGTTPTSSPLSSTPTIGPTNTPARTNTPVPCTVTLPTGTGTDTITNISLPFSGAYNVYSRMSVPASGNSFYLQIDNGCPLQVADTINTNTWDWILSGSISLIAGTNHTVTLYGNSQNVKVDEIILSQSCTPTGTGYNCFITPTPVPVTYGPVLARDTFQRANQSLWGKASDWHTWSGDANTNSVFAISSNTGVVTNTGNTSYNAILGGAAKDGQVLFTGKLSDYTNTPNIGAVLRFSDGNNWYKAYFDGGNLIIQKNVAGTKTTLATTAFTASTNTLYSLRFQATGSTLQARVWQANQTEPTSWMATTTDTSFISGFMGLRIMTHSATATITSFAAYTPETVTQIATDTIQRSNQSHWGTASDGHVWGADASSNSTFSISSNTGQVTNTGNNSYSATLGSTATNAEVLFTGKLSDYTNTPNIGAVSIWSVRCRIVLKRLSMALVVRIERCIVAGNW